jgi:predicted  nucleic acid-binding Zn-ribbon protein
MSTAKTLYELQEIDLEIDQATQNLDQLKERLGKDDNVAAARTALDAARKRLTDLEHQQRSAEWESDDLGAKISHEEKKLYEGSVKNPRELMGLQQELDLLKAKRKERDDQLLAIMMDVDSAQQQVDLDSRQLQHVESAWEADQRQMSTEKVRLEGDLSTQGQKRSSVAERVDRASLGLYEGLRLAKQGRAVARVEQGRCQGCRISLPVSDQQGVRIGHELVTCSNCGRILFAS